MKIISKFTDYYDQMQWVYGQDPNLIFDRRKTDILPYFSDNLVSTAEDVILKKTTVGGRGAFNCSITLSYCGVKLTAVKTKKGYMYKAKDIIDHLTSKGFTEDHIKSLGLGLGNTIKPHPRIKKNENFWEDLKEKPMDFSDSPLMKIHIETRQPILVITSSRTGAGADSIPNCSDLDLASIVPAEKAWRDITEFFSLLNTMQEKEGDILENDSKIESHGFDTKRSFRPKIKD